MRIITLILLFANQICLAQFKNKNDSAIDFSKFNNHNVFSCQKIDSSHIRGNNLFLNKIIYSVYSSINFKYFLEVYDTTFNCDECSGHSHILFYKGNKLIWDAYNNKESIENIYFFENSGTCIIQWINPFADNRILFYDSIGNVIDEFAFDDHFDYLGPNEVIKKKWKGDYLYLTILNSKDEILWSDSILHQNYNVYTYESGNGLFILRSSKDTLYSFDNRFNLKWKKKFPRTNLSISYSGKYFMADLSEPVPNTKYFKHLGYGVYDNNTGTIIKEIGIFKINGKAINFGNGYFIDNTDLILFYGIDSLTKKTQVIISNINGEIISNLIYTHQYNNLSARVKNNTLKIYNSNMLIDSKIINYVP